MIVLTTPAGTQFGVNEELIVKVEAGPKPESSSAQEMSFWSPNR